MVNQSEQTRIIALMNQKGGVGKTTSAVNLGAALAQMGKPTLLIDLDSQAHLTLHCGIDPLALDHSVYDILVGQPVAITELIQKINGSLHVLPAHVNLAGIEAELAPKMITGIAQRVLTRAMHAGSQPLAQQYEYVLIDCPPSLGLLTVNALTLAREVLVPMQGHFLALQGLSQLLDTVEMIKQAFNPDLIVSSILLCMHENQTLLAQEVLADLNRFLTEARQQDAPWRFAKLLEPAIRRNIKLAECPSFGRTVFDYAPECHGARDYYRVAEDLIAHGQSIREARSAEVASTSTQSAEAQPSAQGAEVKIVNADLNRSVLHKVAGGAGRDDASD